MDEILLLIQALVALGPTVAGVLPIIENAINGKAPSGADLETIIAARQSLEAQAKAGT